MTEKELTIIKGFERELHENYVESKREYGVGSPLTKNYLAQWSAIKNLMDALEIKETAQ